MTPQVRKLPSDSEHPLRAFCSCLCGTAEPCYVPVQVKPHSRLRSSYSNVEQQVEQCGGERQDGWAIRQGKLLLEAEYHSIWISPFGEWVDVTPHEDRAERILFLPDNETGRKIGWPVKGAAFKVFHFDGARPEDVRAALATQRLW